MAVPELASAGQADAVRVRVQRHRPAADQRHLVLRQPALVLYRQVLLGRVAPKQLLGEGRAAIGHPVLVADDRDRTLAAGFAV
jgi:hypothetical protein